MQIRRWAGKASNCSTEKKSRKRCENGWGLGIRWMGGEMDMKQPGVSGMLLERKDGERDCDNTVKI